MDRRKTVQIHNSTVLLKKDTYAAGSYSDKVQIASGARLVVTLYVFSLDPGASVSITPKTSYSEEMPFQELETFGANTALTHVKRILVDFHRFIDFDVTVSNGNVEFILGLNCYDNALKTDLDGNSPVEVHGNRADDGEDVTLLLSEEGRVNPRGDYEVDENSKPASISPILHVRKGTGAIPTLIDQLLRATGVIYDNGLDETVVCSDVAIRDENGVPFGPNNPLPTSNAESEGNEIHDFNASAAPVIKNGGSDNHIYTVPVGKIFLFEQVIFDFSGDCKLEAAWGTSGAEDRKVVRFGNPTKIAGFKMKRSARLTAGQTVKLTRTNLDGQDATMYSTIVGVLKDA